MLFVKMWPGEKRIRSGEAQVGGAGEESDRWGRGLMWGRSREASQRSSVGRGPLLPCWRH